MMSIKITIDVNDDNTNSVEITRELPQPTHISIKEGDSWIQFNPGIGKGYNTVHAIKFDDGSIWDCVNGWRPDVRT